MCGVGRDSLVGQYAVTSGVRHLQCVCMAHVSVMCPDRVNRRVIMHVIHCTKMTADARADEVPCRLVSRERWMLCQ